MSFLSENYYNYNYDLYFNAYLKHVLMSAMRENELQANAVFDGI